MVANLQNNDDTEVKRLERNYNLPPSLSCLIIASALFLSADAFGVSATVRGKAELLGAVAKASDGNGLLVQDLDILRNILYSGVWTRYQMAQQKNEEEDICTEIRELLSLRARSPTSATMELQTQ